MDRQRRADFLKAQSEKANARQRLKGCFIARPIDDFIEVQDDGCWLWTGYRNRDGYGTLTRKGRTILAHRYVFGLLVRPVLSDEELDHTCRTPPCCNPKHMTPVSREENTKLVAQRAGRACWYCAGGLDGQNVCARCGADRREVFGLDTDIPDVL